MNLYLDTSALVKLLVAEANSEDVIEFVENSTTVLTSRIAYVEAASALARYRRAKLNAEDYARAQKSLLQLWNGIVTIELDELLASVLTRKHDLRAFDAIHLAALSVHSGGKDANLGFCSFDTRQRAAAKAEKLDILPA